MQAFTWLFVVHIPGCSPWYLSQQQRVPFSMMAAAMQPHADQLQAAKAVPCSETQPCH